MKKLAVIGANEPLLPFYKKAVKLGFDIYAFAWDEGAVCKDLAKEFYPISFTEKDLILEKCKEIGIDGITSFSLESALPTVIYIAEKMNLVSNSSSILDYTGNKYNMRQKCRDNGLDLLDFWLLETIDSLDKQKILYPVIVKPCDGGGARGISLVKHEKEMAFAFEYALKYSKTKKVIVEEYIEGVEASAVFISYEGKHKLITVTDKITSGSPHYVELEHSQPSSFSSDIVIKIDSLCTEVLTILNVKVGVTSIDLRIKENGEPVVIEVNPRMGGNMITSHLVELSTGFDIVKAACDLACGSPLELPEKLFSRNAQVFYYTPYSLWVKEFCEKKKDSSNLEEVAIKELNLVCENNLQRSGYVVYSGEEKILLNTNSY